MVNFTFIPHAQGKILQENLSGHGKKVVIDVSKGVTKKGLDEILRKYL